MSYTALYRKYRPDSFEDIKGQDHIVRTIRNQVLTGRIGHAYLFSGTRGTGKTTMAKLLAKSVNCLDPKDGNPCEVCESCRAIQEGRSLSVIEIDAASNNGVENIRQINEAVKYSHSDGRYLVYIIDEAHQLTGAAANAMLKTLEEPPENVIFILATTETIIDTIRSRCQKFDFHRITQSTIAGRLTDILEKEGIEADPDAISYIAGAGDGSMRDALSILDGCISFNAGQKLTYKMVLETIGATDIDIFIRISEGISKGDAVKVMECISEVNSEGKDLVKFVSDLIWFFRNMIFIKISSDMRSVISITEEDAVRIAAAAEGFSEQELIRIIRILEELMREIRDTTSKRVILEMEMIRILHPESDVSDENSALIARMDSLERRLKAGVGDPEGTFSDNSAGRSVSEENGNIKSEMPGSTPSINADEKMDRIVSSTKGERIYRAAVLEAKAIDEEVERKRESYREKQRKTFTEGDLELYRYLKEHWKELEQRIGGLTGPALNITFVNVIGREDTPESELLLEISYKNDNKDSVQIGLVEEAKEDIENTLSEMYQKNIHVMLKPMNASDMASGGVWATSVNSPGDSEDTPDPAKALSSLGIDVDIK